MHYESRALSIRRAIEILNITTLGTLEFCKAQSKSRFSWTEITYPKNITKIMKSSLS